MWRKPAFALPIFLQLLCYLFFCHHALSNSTWSLIFLVYIFHTSLIKTWRSSAVRSFVVHILRLYFLFNTEYNLLEILYPKQKYLLEIWTIPFHINRTSINALTAGMHAIQIPLLQMLLMKRGGQVSYVGPIGWDSEKLV